MAVTLAAPTQIDVLDALKNFLTGVLPAGTPVLAGLLNRVAEVPDKEFVLMTVLRMMRLRTNVDSPEDLAFTASITGTLMTISAIDARFAGNPIAANLTVFGPGVAAGTLVVEQKSGTPGGVGIYSVSINQSVPSATLSAGTKELEAGSRVTVQLDFHGDPAKMTAGDMASTVQAAFRDAYAYSAFAPETSGISPLHADDPRLVPYVNENQQVELRWILEAELQVNQVIRVPAQYADAVSVEIISVDAIYPP